MDATLIETHKREALYCYKHFKAYQPLNVPAGHEQLRVLEEATRLLPEGCFTCARIRPAINRIF